MTTVIVHGGFTPGNTDIDSYGFYTEILKHAPENVRVLLVPFAKEIEKIQPATEMVMAEFTRNKWQESISFEVADEHSFVEQVRRSDVIYLHGGVTLKLLAALQQFPNFTEWFEGKIIAGESAGANVLAQYFYSQKSDTVRKGLGLLPIKVIPHYTEAYAGKLDLIGEEYDILALREYEYRTYTL